MASEIGANYKPAVTKRKRVFAKTFGIPGFVFSILSAWFTIAQSVVAMTAAGASGVTIRWLNFSIMEIMNVPVLALCFCACLWACFAIVCCVLSRFLGTTTKLNQAGFIISIVSVICSVSLGFFSAVYMAFI